MLNNDPSKAAYHNQGQFYTNAYLNQGESYLPYNSPPSAFYSQKSTDYGPVSPYQEQDLVLVPMHRAYIRAPIYTQINSTIRTFLILSGLLYVLWGVSAIGFEIAIIVNSYWTFYRGLWTGGFLLAAGIGLLVIVFRKIHSMLHLVRFFAFGLLICIIGVVFSALNFATSTRCSRRRRYYSCDDQTLSSLKLAILVVLSVATIHTIVNIFIIYHFHRKSRLAENVYTVPIQ